MRYPGVVRRFSETDWEYSKWVKQLVSQGDAVIDAGANIGYITALFARWVGPEGAVASVEPVPDTFAILENNIRKLGLQNVHCVQCGVSARPGTATMEIPLYDAGFENYYEARVVEEGEAGDGLGRVSVTLDTLDHISSKMERPIAFVKLDVEGHEWEAIQGAEGLIKKDHPAFIIEVQSDLSEKGSKGHLLLNFLRLHGYDAYALNEGGGLRRWVEGVRQVDYLFLTPQQATLLGLG